MEGYVSKLLNNDSIEAWICGLVELLEQKYNAVMCLVQKNEYGLINLKFTIENIYKIYAESFLGQDHLAEIKDQAQKIVNDALEIKEHTA